MDNLDFLDGADAPETTAPAPEAAPEGPPRDESGRFAPKTEAQPEPTPQPPAEPTPEPVAAQPAPEPAKPPPGYVPVSALQDLRKEIKALRDQPAAPLPPPDRYEDPEGHEAWREEQLDQRLYNERLNVSERFARKEHGVETVQQAQAWAMERGQSDPLFAMKLRQEPDPYEFVVQEFKRDQVFASLQDPNELEQFKAWKAAQTNPPPPSPPVPPAPPPQSTPPPRSLASAPSAGAAKPGEQPVGPGVAFDSIF